MKFVDVLVTVEEAVVMRNALIEYAAMLRTVNEVCVSHYAFSRNPNISEGRKKNHDLACTVKDTLAERIMLSKD
jgi:hypothetical protein